MKKITIASLALILSLSIMATSSYARNLQKHRPAPAGLSIGPVATGVDTANRYNHRPRLSHDGPFRSVNGHYYTNQYRNGRWEVRKTWVLPKRNRVWRPGYSNSIGHWVPGKWIITKYERGYLAEKRVWIPR